MRFVHCSIEKFLKYVFWIFKSSFNLPLETLKITKLWRYRALQNVLILIIIKLSLTYFIFNSWSILLMTIPLSSPSWTNLVLARTIWSSPKVSSVNNSRPNSLLASLWLLPSNPLWAFNKSWPSRKTPRLKFPACTGPYKLFLYQFFVRFDPKSFLIQKNQSG